MFSQFSALPVQAAFSQQRFVRERPNVANFFASTLFEEIVTTCVKHSQQKVRDNRPRQRHIVGRASTTPDRASIPSHMSYGLNSLKGGYIGAYIGDYYKAY